MGCPLFKYLQKIAKTWNIQGLISDNILEDIIESFRKNHIIMIDVSLIKFRDKENGGSPSRLWGSVYLSQRNSESKRAKGTWKDEQSAATRCSKEKYEKNSANYRKCKKNWHFPQGKSLRLYFTIWVFRVQKFLWLLPEVPILSWIPVDGGQSSYFELYRNFFQKFLFWAGFQWMVAKLKVVLWKCALGVKWQFPRCYRQKLKGKDQVLQKNCRCTCSHKSIWASSEPQQRVQDFWFSRLDQSLLRLALKFPIWACQL